jgi:hypothetical protein
MSALAIQREWGLGAASRDAPVMINVGDTWQFDFESDKPVSPQQFFGLVANFQSVLGDGDKFKTISFTPVDQTHFRSIVQFIRQSGFGGPGFSKVIDGIKFTLTDGKPVVADEKGLSTGAMVGIGTAVAGTLGTVIYLATRKPRRRRRS